jgi:hypothetical protein
VDDGQCATPSSRGLMNRSRTAGASVAQAGYGAQRLVRGVTGELPGGGVVPAVGPVQADNSEDRREQQVED